MRAMLVAALVLCSGCFRAMVLEYQVTSTARYELSERAAVWGRALSAFQYRGQTIVMSDPVGGVLRTDEQRGSTPCRHTELRTCKTIEHAQLTIGPDGTAFLSQYVVARGSIRIGETSPFTDEEWTAVQKQCDDFLHFVVGSSRDADAPAQPKRAGMTGI